MLHSAMVASGALILLAAASPAGGAVLPDEILVQELRENPTWLATDKCPETTIFLDESFGTGFTPSPLSQLLTILREHGCKLEKLPGGSWTGFDYNLLRRAGFGPSGQRVALSVTMSGLGTAGTVAAIRWSNGVNGEEHTLHFARRDGDWTRTMEKDKHLVIVTKF